MPDTSLSTVSPALLKSISVKGAREHNLKNISVDLPRDRSLSSLVYQVPENPALPLIPSIQKASVGM